MNAARSRASGSRSTSRSVLIGTGGQATGPSSVMAGNLSHARRAARALTTHEQGHGSSGHEGYRGSRKKHPGLQGCGEGVAGQPHGHRAGAIGHCPGRCHPSDLAHHQEQRNGWGVGRTAVGCVDQPRAHRGDVRTPGVRDLRLPVQFEVRTRRDDPPPAVGVREDATGAWQMGQQPEAVRGRDPHRVTAQTRRQCGRDRQLYPAVAACWAAGAHGSGGFRATGTLRSST